MGALLALAAAIAVVWFLLSLFQPFVGAGHGRVIVVIPKDSSASKVGSILARDGVVSSGFFFDLRALVEGKRDALHSGRFLLRHDESYAAAIAALSKPPPVRIPVKVVIPEGENRLQIAAAGRGRRPHWQLHDGIRALPAAEPGHLRRVAGIRRTSKASCFPLPTT